MLHIEHIGDNIYAVGDTIVEVDYYTVPVAGPCVGDRATTATGIKILDITALEGVWDSALEDQLKEFIEGSIEITPFER